MVNNIIHDNSMVDEIKDYINNLIHYLIKVQCDLVTIQNNNLPENIPHSIKDIFIHLDELSTTIDSSKEILKESDKYYQLYLEHKK